MPLLQWSSLVPQGPDNLAAIRFQKAIHIESLKIFQKGLAPFKHAPELIAETSPDAFFVDVFFNVHPLLPVKDKQRAPNALVHTSFAYTGGMMDYAVDMGSEYATRLLIVKGNFTVLSMAIYGHVVEDQPQALPYEPKPFPSIEPFPLSNSLNPANLPEPSQLAKQLLSLMPESPDLALAVRLMFCLKPSEEDWDDPDFPYLYADMEDRDSDFDLEGVVNSLTRPVRDDASFETLVDRLHDFAGDNDQAYYYAKLLSIAAPQQSGMATALLESIDVLAVMDEVALNDQSTVLFLLDSCTSRTIARYFDDERFLDSLRSIKSQDVQAAAQKLERRILGWKNFENALVKDDADFDAAVRFILDVTSEENSTGIWVTAMSEIQTKRPMTSQLPILSPTSSSEFNVLVRAVVGVINVLAAWAWADSLGVDECRERILAVLTLWQEVDGYSQILGHLLHLRQLTRRLGWIISDSDPPRKSGIFAERLLLRLVEDPKAILQEELYKAVQDLKQPLAVITEEDRLALRKIAYVAEDGLPAAVEELLFTSDRPFSPRRLKTLRVSMAIIQKQIVEDADDGELRVMNAFWDEHAHGLVPRLLDLLSDLSGDVTKYFEVEPMIEGNPKLLLQLFATASDLLGLLQLLSADFPLTGRHLRILSAAALDLCTCAAILRETNSSSSKISGAATLIKTRSRGVLKTLVNEDLKVEAGAHNALVIFRALLSHCSQSTLDPVFHAREGLHVIDLLLPPHRSEHEPTFWVTSVIPKSLPELKAFFSSLDTEKRLLLFFRIAKLDEGFTGVGEWLLTEDLKVWAEATQDMSSTSLPREYKHVLRHQVVNGMDFLWRICNPATSEDPIWLQEALQTDEALSAQLLAFFSALLEHHYTTPSLNYLIQSLSKEPHLFLSDLRWSLVLHLLRIAQLDPTTPGVMDSFVPLLLDLPADAISPHVLMVEVGLALAAFSREAASLEADTAGALLSLLQWIAAQDNQDLITLKGLKEEDFETLCDFCALLLPEKKSSIWEIKGKIHVDREGTEIIAPQAIELHLDDEVRLSLAALDAMLNRPADTPSLDSRPTTPTKPRAGNKTPDILGMLISPPTALLRSPAATGLTKTYAKNDFRQLRQAPSARLNMNTSRLPSMHGTPEQSRYLFATAADLSNFWPFPDLGIVGLDFGNSENVD